MIPRCIHRDRSGFTLIELLTTIAILGALAALLFPALRQVRERSTAATCMSNVREVTMAALSYAIDHEGEFPFTYKLQGGRTAGKDFWEKILDYLPGRNANSREATMSVYQCPRARALGWNHLANDDPATLAGNHVIIHNKPVELAPLSLTSVVQYPSRAMLFADSSSQSLAWGGTMSPTVSAHVPPAFLHGGKTMARGGNGGGQWRYFEDGKSVFAFGDGHVELLPVTPVTMGDSRTVTGRLFWVGREQW